MKLPHLIAVCSCAWLCALPAAGHEATPEQLEIERAHLATAERNIEAYRKSDAVLVFKDADGSVLSGANVKIDQVSHDFLFGALSDAAFTGPFSDREKERIKSLFLDVFNFTIAKVYWAAFEARQGRPNWPALEQFLQWTEAHEVTVKGHPLVWTHPAGTPGWLLARPDDEATRLLEARVRNLVGGYAGRIDHWDVVNEPVTTVPWEWALREDVNTDLEILSGPRYDVTAVTIKDIAPTVSAAFKWAAEANPRGHYILNDFFLFAKPDVLRRFHALVTELRARGAPVRGLGIQAHEPRTMWFSPVQVAQTLETLSEFGLPLHITEFIPQSNGQPIEGWRSGTWTEEAQADFAEQLYTLCFGHPSVNSINWWSFSDRDTWLEGGGLVDRELQPKPAYTRLKALIRDRWMTRNVALQTNEDGATTFRGFHGKYHVDITLPNGETRRLQIHLRQNEGNRWEFTL